MVSNTTVMESDNKDVVSSVAENLVESDVVVDAKMSRKRDDKSTTDAAIADSTTATTTTTTTRNRHSDLSASAAEFVPSLSVVSAAASASMKCSAMMGVVRALGNVPEFALELRTNEWPPASFAARVLAVIDEEPFAHGRLLQRINEQSQHQWNENLGNDFAGFTSRQG